MFGTTIATRWFDARRGVVLGLFAAANATRRAGLLAAVRAKSSPASVGARARSFSPASPWTLIPLNLFGRARAPERSRPAALRREPRSMRTLPRG